MPRNTAATQSQKKNAPTTKEMCDWLRERLEVAPAVGEVELSGALRGGLQHFWSEARSLVHAGGEQTDGVGLGD